jgi:hypothetical protein
MRNRPCPAFVCGGSYTGTKDSLAGGALLWQLSMDSTAGEGRQEVHDSDHN